MASTAGKALAAAHTKGKMKRKHIPRPDFTPRGEAQAAGDDEDHGGQEVLQAGAEAADEVGHKLGGAQSLGDVADSPGEAEDQDE